MMSILDDLGIDDNNEIINKIYGSIQIAEDLSRSIFIVIAKKKGM